MGPSTGSSLLAPIFLGLAVLHGFSGATLHHLVRQSRLPDRFKAVSEKFTEVEFIFAAWAVLYLIAVAFIRGPATAAEGLGERNFTEPFFVFVILLVCATETILDGGTRAIDRISDGLARILPLSKPIAFFLATLILGPLLGSVITEPVAMTITAGILLEHFYSHPISDRLKYATLSLLFVNVSIGGTLTPYAAPPILLVAHTWGWDLGFTWTHFGWKALVAILVSTLLTAFIFRGELAKVSWMEGERGMVRPKFFSLLHLMLLLLIVHSAEHAWILFGLALAFLAFARLTGIPFHELRYREAMKVAIFLAALVILGAPQREWLTPFLASLKPLELYIGSMGLTAVIDNAALTYLGSQVPALSDFARYSLVAGAVVGGGLTVIANAPNPIGYEILHDRFGEDSIRPFKLFVFALVPTAIAAICFWGFSQ